MDCVKSNHDFVVGTMPTLWRGALCLPILLPGAHVSLETVFWCWQT